MIAPRVAIFVFCLHGIAVVFNHTCILVYDAVLVYNGPGLYYTGPPRVAGTAADDAGSLNQHQSCRRYLLHLPILQLPPPLTLAPLLAPLLLDPPLVVQARPRWEHRR